MRRSISRRFFLAVFLVNIVLVVVMASLVVFLTKQLEQEFLHQDYIEEREFIVSELVQNDAVHHRTKEIIIEFIPNNQQGSPPYYEVFQGLGPVDQKIMELGDRRYLINIEELSAGTFYHARDVSKVLAREARFIKITALLSLVAIALSFLLAYSSSKRIVLPLRMLAKKISDTGVENDFLPISAQFQDRELHDISTVFNQFLAELGSYVERERSLVGMASHELKTPISVILGAIEVLKSKHELSEKESRLVDRIETAATEMSANITVLLKLSRKDGGLNATHSADLAVIAAEVKQDLATSFSVDERLQVKVAEASSISADPVLVKMLVRNLVQNALQHTKGSVVLTVSKEQLSIDDGGDGVNKSPFNVELKKLTTESMASSQGLGLYIVTLICERLGWSARVVRNQRAGSTVTVQGWNKAN